MAPHDAAVERRVHREVLLGEVRGQSRLDQHRAHDVLGRALVAQARPADRRAEPRDGVGHGELLGPGQLAHAGGVRVAQQRRGGVADVGGGHHRQRDVRVDRVVVHAGREHRRQRRQERLEEQPGPQEHHGGVERGEPLLLVVEGLEEAGARGELGAERAQRHHVGDGGVGQRARDRGAHLLLLGAVARRGEVEGHEDVGGVRAAQGLRERGPVGDVGDVRLGAVRGRVGETAGVAPDGPHRLPALAQAAHDASAGVPAGPQDSDHDGVSSVLGDPVRPTLGRSRRTNHRRDAGSPARSSDLVDDQLSDAGGWAP